VKKKASDTMDAIDANLVWSAACTAYRINGGYFKEPETIGDQIIRPTNRAVVRQALDNPTLITDADRNMAEQCRRYMATAVTIQALKTELGEWARITARVCGLDTVDSMYDFSVITAMPQSYIKQLKKESVDARLARCETGAVGKINDKVELAVEIVRNNYSANFNTWFVSAITNDNRAVFFAYREAMQPDTHVTIRGTIKRHTDSATQLNRVKLVGESK
jgi:ABC-type taurine transport system substrate-binding protein